jgi:hypothetical protein
MILSRRYRAPSRFFIDFPLKGNCNITSCTAVRSLSLAPRRFSQCEMLLTPKTLSLKQHVYSQMHPRISCALFSLPLTAAASWNVPSQLPRVEYWRWSGNCHRGMQYTTARNLFVLPALSHSSSASTNTERTHQHHCFIQAGSNTCMMHVNILPRRPNSDASVLGRVTEAAKFGSRFAAIAPMVSSSIFKPQNFFMSSKDDCANAVVSRWTKMRGRAEV